VIDGIAPNGAWAILSSVVCAEGGATVTDMNGGVNEIDRLMSETRHVLASMRAARTSMAADQSDGSDPPGTDADLRGEGADPDERVRAIVTAGRLRSLELDPRLLREGSAATCERVMAAVNAAFTDLANKAGEASGAAEAAVPDPSQLSGKLAELQDASMRTMTTFTQALVSALDRIQARERSR
jgi:hypothetical protein